MSATRDAARTSTARLQGAVLALLGAVLGRLACGGQFTHNVLPATRPLVLAAAAVMCLLGVGAAVTGGRALRAGHAHGSRAGWLVLAPMLTIAVVAPPALGVLTAARPPVVPPRPGSGFAPLPPGDPVTVALSDVLLRTVWHAGGTLHGRSIRVLGFVARSRPDGFVLARLVITCCAADARPYDLDIATPSRAPGPAPPTGEWVAVTGRYLGIGPDGPLVPVLRASNVLPVAEPADPYG